MRYYLILGAILVLPLISNVNASQFNEDEIANRMVAKMTRIIEGQQELDPKFGVKIKSLKGRFPSPASSYDVACNLALRRLMLTDFTTSPDEGELELSLPEFVKQWFLYHLESILKVQPMRNLSRTFPEQVEQG